MGNSVSNGAVSSAPFLLLSMWELFLTARNSQRNNRWSFEGVVVDVRFRMTFNIERILKRFFAKISSITRRVRFFSSAAILETFLITLAFFAVGWNRREFLWKMMPQLCLGSWQKKLSNHAHERKFFHLHRTPSNLPHPFGIFRCAYAYFKDFNFFQLAKFQSFSSFSRFAACRVPDVFLASKENSRRWKFPAYISVKLSPFHTFRTIKSFSYFNI